MNKQLINVLRKHWLFGVAGIIVILVSIIPIRLAIASRIAPQPQAILTLGGGQIREEFTAQFAQKHPTLDIWVSSGIPPEKARAIFYRAEISDNRLYLDYRAADTVTNFTSLVQDFQQRRIHHLYLITSDFHMPRAKVIATIVLGSQGITFTPVSIPSREPQESIIRIIRDGIRSILWLFTGLTGASINPEIS
ncbi:MAG: YdcF family protein [Cyanobacteria bacterium J06633_8]